MTLKVYNTLTGKKEKFLPLKKKEVRMYVCGVTVYDDCHLGHARCYVAFDVVYRYLKYKDYRVKYVQNITDVDDKIIAKARELKKSDIRYQKSDVKALVRKVTGKYTKEYFKWMDYLKVKRADLYPRATEHIENMIKLIQKLLDKGYAYEIDGDVYFNISKFSSYGKLSGRSVDEMRAGARVEVDERKRNPLDFALWKRAKEGEPIWNSPWGAGRPGWHIECSAMSMKYLGESFDIHGGGQDLIFPHHENEIAQSEAYSGKPFVKYWLHNGFVTTRGEKMSKSLGNIFTLKELFKEFPDPEVARLFLLSRHYRSPVDFTKEKLVEIEKRLSHFYNLLDFILQALKGRISNKRINPRSLSKEERRLYQEIRKTDKEFDRSLDDDFNTAKALSSLDSLAKVTNALKDNPKIRGNKALLSKVYRLLKEKGKIIGFFEEHSWEKMISIPDRKEVEKLIAQRDRARKEGDWDLADRIRSNLKKRRIILEDHQEGTTWKKKTQKKLDKN
ncbi:MAG TPA: cysteine--tRNA ligase [bacterium]|nr:cysteine--tRNA ligase [bacterium]